MNHIDNDTLLKSVLRLLDENREAELQEHLTECLLCSARLSEARERTDILGSFSPELYATPPPLPGHNDKREPWLIRAAAMLTMGFLIGYFTAETTRPSQVHVVPPHLVTKSPPASIETYVSCEQVDLRAMTVSR